MHFAAKRKTHILLQILDNSDFQNILIDDVGLQPAAIHRDLWLDSDGLRKHNHGVGTGI